MPDPIKPELDIARLRELLALDRPGNYYENAEIRDLLPAVLDALEGAQAQVQMSKSEVLCSREYTGMLEAFAADIKVIVAERDSLKLDKERLAAEVTQLQETFRGVSGVGYGVLGESLLSPGNQQLLEGCTCSPGRCMAPRVMGMQMPCRDPQKAAGLTGGEVDDGSRERSS